MILKIDAKYEEKPICCFQNEKNGEFWSKHSKVSKICTLIGPFRVKYITFDLKKYRGVIFHDTEKSCKIWSSLLFEKWHEEFVNFSPEDSKISKTCTLIGCFWPNYKIFEPKKYRGVMFNGTQRWYKVCRKTDLYFQKWHDEFSKLSPGMSGSLKIGTFIRSFYLK